MKKTIILITTLLLTTALATAANDGGTESPFAFGAGARELSLGGSSIANASFATAAFWNSSRLASAEQFTLSGFHSRLYDSDVAYQYFGLVVPTLDFGNFGIGIFRLGIDGIELRDSENLLLGQTQDNRMAIYLAYGRVVSGYDVGFSASIEHHSMESYSATSSPGISLSVSRRFYLESSWMEHLSLAVNGNNILKRGLELADENIKYPARFDAGAALAIIPSDNWEHLATFSISLSMAESRDPRLAMGLEYDLVEMLQFRGGMRDGSLSFGAGVTYGSFTFDYALVDRDMGSLHMFSLNSAFGTPTSVKRAMKAEERESQFNNLMSERLTSRNLEMINSLIEKGKGALDAGQLIEAGDHFDRAMFIARSSGVDTTEIHELADVTQRRLVIAESSLRYSGLMDSATVNLQDEDWLAARYYANLALEEMPESDKATGIIRRADQAINESVARDELIQNKLWALDSLLSYGQIEQASNSIATLMEYAPDNSAVQLAYKRVSFERWRRYANAAFSREDYTAAQEALDSVSTIFPGHQWCTDLRNRIQKELSAASAYIEPEPTVAEVKLTPELKRVIESAYRDAQEAFQNGDLNTAIANWEKVENLAPDYESVREYLVSAYKFVGVQLYGDNDLQQAVAVWKKAAKLDPANNEIGNYISRTENEILKLKELSYEQ